MTAGGRRFRFRATMIIGNKQQVVGMGVAKGKDVAQAIEKATRMAKKKAISILMMENTISHETRAKFNSAEVILRPQRKGRGLVAGGVVRIICELAGIKDISSKLLGNTSNKINIALATMKALGKIRPKIKQGKG